MCGFCYMGNIVHTSVYNPQMYRLHGSWGFPEDLLPDIDSIEGLTVPVVWADLCLPSPYLLLRGVCHFLLVVER